MIEILVVVAILAILAALAVPAALNMVAKGKASQCQSNLRQLAVAFQTYAGENNGRLAFQQGGCSKTWHVEIGPYIGIGETVQEANKELADNRGKRPLDVLACPASTNVTRSGNYSDYGMNFLVNDHYSKSSKQNPVFGIPNPSKVMLLADSVNCNRRLSPYEPNGDLDPRHPRETVNVLFVDGHVEVRTLASMTTEIVGDPRFQPPWGWEGWAK